MRIIARQNQGEEYALVERKKEYDSIFYTHAVTDELNVKRNTYIDRSFYIGGEHRGYSISVRITKDDLIKMLVQIENFEERNIGLIDQDRELFEKEREKLIVKNIKHREKLARRRQIYKNKKA